MQNQPYNYYSPRQNNFQGSYKFPSGQGQSNYNSGRTEDALDRFQKEQTIKPSYNQSLTQNPESFQDPYQYPSSPVKQPINNDNYNNSPTIASPTKSNKANSPRSSYSPSPFREGTYYGDAMDQTHKYTLHKPGHLSHLTNEIVAQQPEFSKKIEQSMKSRSYNILSNHSQVSSHSEYAGMPYGYTIKALSRNQEPEKKLKALNAKGVDTSAYYRSSNAYGSFASPKQQSYNQSIFKNQEPVAGKQNYYGETEFRYAHHPQGPDPLNQDQMYGIRALKNMSGVKLY